MIGHVVRIRSSSRAAALPRFSARRTQRSTPTTSTRRHCVWKMEAVAVHAVWGSWHGGWSSGQLKIGRISVRFELNFVANFSLDSCLLLSWFAAQMTGDTWDPAHLLAEWRNTWRYYVACLVQSCAYVFQSCFSVFLTKHLSFAHYCIPPSVVF